uniref:Uncharacterized protein n=1 Tax=Palisada sp. TaxID=1955416 RepID=A0A1Z1MRG8_9FLOR|nr:hypothetical protein [Palisada sp.]
MKKSIILLTYCTHEKTIIKKNLTFFKFLLHINTSH